MLVWIEDWHVVVNGDVLLVHPHASRKFKNDTAV